MKIQKDSNPNNNLKYISIIASITNIISFFFLPVFEFKKKQIFFDKDTISLFEYLEFIFSIPVLGGLFSPELFLFHLPLLLPLISVICILCNFLDYKSVQITIKKEIPLNIVFGFISLLSVIDIYTFYDTKVHIMSYGFHVMVLSSFVILGIGLRKFL